jgi:hypothetical protein
LLISILAGAATHLIDEPSTMENLPISLGLQTAWLLLLTIPVACIAWTVTHD